MFIKAQLVVKSYVPLTLEKGEWFVQKHYKGTDREFTEIFELTEIPRDKDEFLSINELIITSYIIPGL